MQEPVVFPAVEAAGAVGPAPVTLIIPAELYYAALVKAVAGHLGARAGLTVTEITDLRTAVDEACGLLLPSTARHGKVCCRFVQDETGLRMRFSVADTGQDTPDTDGFGWLVLAALVDGLDWSREGGRVRVEILKRPLERDV